MTEQIKYKYLYLIILSLFFITNCSIKSNSVVKDIKIKDIDTLWTRIFENYGVDFGSDIIETSDNNIVVCGSKAISQEKLSDFWIAKINSSGKIIWEKTYGEKNPDYGYSIIETNDKGFIFVGAKNAVGDPKVQILKIDSIGNEIWSKTFEGKHFAYPRKIIKTNDNNFVAGCMINQNNSGKYDYWLIKINNNGNEVWNTIYNSENSNDITNVIETSENNLLMVGRKNHKDEFKGDAFIICANKNGNKIWEQTYDTTFNNDEIVINVKELIGKQFMMLVYNNNYSHPNRLKFLKIDNKGSVIQDTILNEKDLFNVENFAYKNNIFAIIGEKEREYPEKKILWLSLKDENLNTKFEKIFIKEKLYGYANKIIFTKDDNILMIGRTFMKDKGCGDIYVIKYRLITK